MTYKGQFCSAIFANSPWNNPNQDNIFKKPRKPQFNYGDFNIKFNGKIFLLILIVIAGLWLTSGIYEVKEGEESVVIRFGKFVRKGHPGLNYHLPSPIENVIIEKINQSRRIEIGYRSGMISTNRSSSNNNISSESSMLTGDENIVELYADIMWHINDIEKYVFALVNPEDTVKTVSESAIREVIGKTPILSILSNQKQEITDNVEQLIQEILDMYGVGVTIEMVQLLKAEPPAEVIDSYRDVQTAKADKERIINQAYSYSNDILPAARGKAEKITQAAEAYKESIVAKAKGDAHKFTAIYTQYLKNKQLTKDRFYLDSMQSILQNVKKFVIGNHNNFLPHMNIQQ
ncbi:MAG: FtsH protease activity modulator HflK [Rickettsiaceae bacterium]